jgi:hypothetical protein
MSLLNAKGAMSRSVPLSLLASLDADEKEPPKKSPSIVGDRRGGNSQMHRRS